MDALSQSPFFPVPVHWFEIPVDTARWGFVRQQQPTSAPFVAANSNPLDRAEEPPATATSAQTTAPETANQSQSVGRILNELA